MTDADRELNGRIVEELWRFGSVLADVASGALRADEKEAETEEESDLCK